MTGRVPGDTLLAARRATALYSRELEHLSDEDLRGDSTAPGWSRSHVVAYIALEARALAIALDGLASITHPDYEPVGEWGAAVDFTATLGASALRNLHHHTVVHLNVACRDLPDAAWSVPIEVSGRRAAPSALMARRELQIVKGTLALRTGARVVIDSTGLPVVAPSAPLFDSADVTTKP